MAERLTVALPTCNGARHLGPALRSILSQSDNDFDLVVSDDRSDDDSPGFVREITGDRARISVNSERLGLAGNWNRCAELASTPWVAIFHQDDVMHSDHVASHKRKFRSDLGMVASAADVIDDQGRDVPEKVVGRGGLGDHDRIFAADEALPHFSDENPLRCSAVSLRVEALKAIGGFNPSYRYVVDWDGWVKVVRSWGLAWIARPTVAIRWHAASETHRFKVGVDDLDESLRFMKSMGRMGKNSRRRMARAFLNRAYEASRIGSQSLGRQCLRRAAGLSPGILGRVAVDPRLAFRMLRLFM